MPASYSDLPGWNEDRVEAAWPALLVGCKALLAKAATRATWQRSCDEAAAVGSGDARGIRNFIESHFKPYRVTSTDGKTAGVVSGYYEPLLGGARARSERYSVPLYARPDDLLEVDLAELYPELKGKRVRGRVDGRRVVPYWSRADIDARPARCDGAAARLRGRSGRGVLPPDPGLGTHPTRGRQPFASATPTRTGTRTARSRRC